MRRLPILFAFALLFGITGLVLAQRAESGIPAVAQAQPGNRAAQPAGVAPVPASQAEGDNGPFVSETVPAQSSLPVRDLPLAVPHPEGLDREVNPRVPPRAFLQGPVTLPQGGPDPLLANGVNAGFTPTATLSFDGLTRADGGATPPDTVGDVGPNHYIQIVNATVFSIYDKMGTRLTGPTDLSTVWTGTTGTCATSDSGDPIVVYDQLADRWLLSQFRGGFANGVCVAISQTPDPTGAYHLYEFATPEFPDYFKFGVWPDAYYMSANENTYTAYAFDRAKMLLGQPATSVRFNGQTNMLMPADVDGPAAPPAGTPGLFYTFKDDTYPDHGGGVDRLEVFALDADFTTPANSTFTLVATIPITSYTYTVCGFFTLECVPQPGTTRRVDAVSEWPMFRLAYRNFGTHEAMVSNFAVDVGSDRSGIRWFELRRTGATPWSLYQEGTHAPGTEHRFMGSMAQDRLGNIALGYNISSSTLFPSLRFATRLATDPLGTLQAEATLHTGGGSQTGANRWGDYSAMSVDPSDDCTFWFTGEYYQTTASNNWRTRIGSFTIPGCAAPTAVELSTLEGGTASSDGPARLLAIAGLLVAGLALARTRRA